MDLHWRQQIKLHPAADAPWNINIMTILQHQTMVDKLPIAKTVHLGNTAINFIRCRGMVTLLHSRHLQALCSLITTLYSTWHTVCSHEPVQVNYTLVMRHHGKDMTSTKAVMAGLKCSPLCSIQDECHHLQVHWECLKDHQETIQSFSEHLPALLLHQDMLAHLGDPPIASQQRDCSHQCTHRKQMIQVIKPSPCCGRIPMMNMM